ncbi:MAG: translesion DNA synthesis-associated protein ImuA [Gammaproteobacteria bacterium]|nr:translesion DNA synthesis-associated protein ImuA [Gammaproteobacteria bacterium]
MNGVAELLLRHPALWRGAGAGVPETVPTSFRALDARLPGGGWPLATLIELLVPATGVGEIRLLLPALKRLAMVEGTAPRWVAWLAPPHLPYAPALADAGLDPARMLVVRPRAGPDRLWAMEQALRSGACAAVLGWAGTVDGTALRRLKLAAEEGRTPAFLLRPATHRGDGSPAALRLVLAARDFGLDVEILKSRGGAPARVERLPIH